jgi:hypothetical protein
MILYKAPQGIWRTQSLFWETWVRLPIEKRTSDPVFSFDTSLNGMINCRETFMELEDHTGYDWAIKYLHSWEHFEYLLQRDWFAKEVDNWNRELHAKLKARALKRITKIADLSENEAQALAASKYLAEKGWEKASRGRPSKGELKGEMKRLVEEAERTSEDMQRIGLTVINGGKS